MKAMMELHDKTRRVLKSYVTYRRIPTWERCLYTKNLNEEIIEQERPKDQIGRAVYLLIIPN
ncbi:hypothetical protein DPMN_066666 [Dreissena polymorpha]|uniref:Uncharacterized protein n=1 Tax=Dreissena polymorpha TaxID=45954 RepID=A0A9D4BKQ4_DREPO|nr:hypothetical protein DPMN_066666 [Dreissena polymorpha]